ncbi:exodeoxyribonuclease-3 [Isoptericola jiangsuensis]|uniref:Exodeoxyribonuclease-3 n=1 Tax=Isoptericola jiangsuensis TaxID=548579 RepID=A0A2A9ES00_9MICO|nr:exodeoxyribonuclease III [Isoptericola jiangsuensis]PFG41784.1 exodeoxyribonuclease-3 [Isoptericola jiangsuensis]
MRIATWNVNSIRTRLPRVLAFLERSGTDVLAIQETKCRADQFPTAAFADAGYEVAAAGYHQWNGVAVVSRVGLADVEESFGGQPRFGKAGAEPALEARALGATCGGVRVWSLYVPHGRTLTDPHYAYKLEWLAALRARAQEWVTAEPDLPLGLLGDWNVIPRDTDVWDVTAFEGHTHVSAPEREAFDAFATAGLTEVTREHLPAERTYTYWDYQQLAFPRDKGLRIDFAYASAALAARVTGVTIDRDERRGTGASDHVPVVLDVADLPTDRSGAPSGA